MSEKRYLVLAEDFSGDPHYGKTARGIIHYGLTPVVALVDSTRAGEEQDGVPIVGSVEEALPLGPTTASSASRPPAGASRRSGASSSSAASRTGSTSRTASTSSSPTTPSSPRSPATHGVELRDLRRPPEGLNVPTGENLRVPARIVLTVGSDCAIGKMTVALELDRAARARGLASQFVPTGQTGIAIAGWGLCVDAVVSDFIAGASERLVVEGAERGGELLFVEGQGSITHPAYSGVTLGLIHGSAPHVFVLCHHAGSTEHEGFPGHPLTPLPGARRPARAAVAARPSGDGGRDRAEHARARRGRGASGDRGGRRPRRACPPTTRCASGPSACWTRFSPRLP